MTIEPALLSCHRVTWRVKDLCIELGDCAPKTVMRWARKLRCQPDHRRAFGAAPNLWTHGGAAKLVTRWRQWWTMRGHNPDVQCKKFSGALPAADPNQLNLDFHAKKTVSQKVSPAKACPKKARCRRAPAAR